MKRILLLALVIYSTITNAQTYSPLTGIPSNKPYALATASPDGSRSMFFDGSNFIWRAYNGTAEVLTYLNLSQYRTGNFPIVVHTGGTLNGNGTYTGGINTLYWFKDGTADGNLVPYFTNIYTADGILTGNRGLNGGGFSESHTNLSSLSFAMSGGFNVQSANNYFGSSAGSASVGMTLSYTDAIKLPGGTTAQRPSGVLGLMRFNSTLGVYEIYNPNTTSWDAFGADTLNISTDPPTGVRIAPRVGGNTEYFATLIGAGGLTITKNPDSSITFDGSAISAGNVVIGNPVISGINGRILYSGTGNNLQQSPTFIYDSTNNRFGIGVSPTVLGHFKAAASQAAEVKIESQTAAQPARITLVGNSVNWQMTHEANTGGGSGNMNLDFAYNGASKVSFLNGGGVLINTSTPVASAALVVGGTTQATLLSKMTNAQQNAIGSPVSGLVLYNTDSSAYTYYDGTGWRKIGGNSSSVLTQFSVQGDGTSGNKIQLTNDQNTPSNNSYYGESNGAKGWVPLGYINVLNAGLVGDGVTDDGPALNTLIAAGNLNLYFPMKTTNYLINTTVILPTNIHIYSDGAKIKTTANDTLFKAQNKVGISIKGLVMAGSTSGASQIGISLDSCIATVVIDCQIDSMGKSAIEYHNNGLLGGADFTRGNQMLGCRGIKNATGILLGNRGEYETITNCKFTNGTKGIVDSAGNNLITACTFDFNVTGITITLGDNDAHAGFVNCSANHSPTTLDANGVDLGEKFTNCFFYAGTFKVQNCTALSFEHCDMGFSGGTDSLILVSNSDLAFIDCKRYSLGTKIRQSGANIPVWLDFGNAGMSLTDVANNVSFPMVMNNGQVKLGGSTTSYIWTQKTIIGANALSFADFGRDACFSGLATGYGGTSLSDPNQFYISAGTGNTLTALNYHVSGLYALLINNAGRTLIGTGTDNGQQFQVNGNEYISTKSGIGVQPTTTTTLTVGPSDYNSSYGTFFTTTSGTSNDPITAGSGTVTLMGAARFQTPTFSATNTSVTYTNGATVVIDGVPANGTHVTINNPYAFYITAGASWQQDIWSRHLYGNTAVPGIAAGTGAGTSPTVSVSGSDEAGVITVTTGTGPSGSNATVVTVTYNVAYAAAGVVILEPGNANAAALSGATQVFINDASSTTAHFLITSGTSALSATTTYIWNFHVISYNNGS